MSYNFAFLTLRHKSKPINANPSKERFIYKCPQKSTDGKMPPKRKGITGALCKTIMLDMFMVNIIINAIINPAYLNLGMTKHNTVMISAIQITANPHFTGSHTMREYNSLINIG